MMIGKKDFTRLAVSMGIANRSEVKIFFNELPKDAYDDDRDIIALWRMVEQVRRIKHVRKIIQASSSNTRYRKPDGKEEGRIIYV